MKKYIIFLCIISITNFNHAKKSNTVLQDTLNLKDNNILEVKNSSLEKLVDNIIKKDNNNPLCILVY